MFLAGIFALISAALHIFAFVLGGFTEMAVLMIPVGIVWGLLGLGLIRGYRLIACVGFVISLAGVVAAFGAYIDPEGLPALWGLLVLIADLGVAVPLFLHIWRR
ncbi:MAG: hypothetical protein AAF401_02995 [Pseudomonadota bacterium]